MANLTAKEKQALEEVFACLYQKKCFKKATREKASVFWQYLLHKKRKILPYSRT